MSEYQILIVDDEPLARKVIREHLEKFDEPLRIHEEGDPLAALKYLESQKVDVLYLDINMPGLSGLDIAANLKTEVITVFTTAYEEYALKAFELAAFDYMVKPISMARFLQSFERIKAALSSTESPVINYLFVKEGRRTYRIKYDDVLRFQAYDDYVKVITDEKTYLVKARLSDYKSVDNNRFFQIHRSHIINLDHISFLEGNMVHISGENVPISSSYTAELNRRLSLRTQ